jgi:REP element-mobilizing transposase RayT
MPYEPQKHHRRSIRLKNYDYAQPGAYFVTLLTHDREELFGEFMDGRMYLSRIGEIVGAIWRRLPAYFSLRLDEWVIMPNHLHGIIWILDSGKGEAFADKGLGISCHSVADASPQREPIGTQSGSLGAIIQNFKSISTRKINQALHTPGAPVWQRNYFEHIIRDEAELGRIRQYIRDNPVHWEM